MSTGRRPGRATDICWAEVASCESLRAAVQLVAGAYDFREHPYFVWARQPSTRRDDFRRSQLSFRYAVEGWSQALAAVTARVGQLELRRGLVRNIADEHGEEDDRSHKASFHRYLVALGATDEELDAPCLIAVRAFQQATTNFCLAQPYEAGAAMLGIVEYVYVDVSAEIVRLLEERGWAEPGSQDHYEVHEELDVQHAKDLLDLAGEHWSSQHAREGIALGLLLGAHLFWQLYLDLLPRDEPHDAQ